MSASEVKKQIDRIHELMNSRAYIIAGEITPSFLQDINLLQQKCGEYIGRTKAKHTEYSADIDDIDKRIKGSFGSLISTSSAAYCFKLVNMAIQDISQLISFVETLEASPEGEKVTRQAYEKVVDENKTLKKAIEIVRGIGLPEIDRLLETARGVGLHIDEYWVLALCSSNLIEAVVNKKLEKLGGKVEGSFEDRYKKLCELINQKENKHISRLLPSALYKGIRNKLDHASDSNRVTPEEAIRISEIVKDFIHEVFPSIDRS